jgi:1,4-dihydroxy-2-naphthoate polyprenyltransferase
MEEVTLSSLSINQRTKAWITLTRPPFHTVGLFPMTLGMFIAWSPDHPLNWAVFALANLAIVLILLVTYLSGEYYDYEGDSLNKDFNTFSGGSRVLQTGLLPRRHALIATYIAFALAIVIGLVIQFRYDTGPYTIPLGAFGLICGYFYSSRPFQWAYRGIGEVLIAICYGWLTINTGYYLQTGEFALLPSLVSIPIGITIFLVILINEFPDYQADMAVNKRNLTVRFGQKKMAMLYAVLVALSLGILFIALPYGLPWLAAVLSVVLLPLVILNIRVITKKGYEQAIALKGLCARTLMLNLGFTLIYIIALTLSGRNILG